ncbi:hypothetical protein LOK49_LG07G01422, partial [Camellia lanceoleosa]
SYPIYHRLNSYNNLTHSFNADSKKPKKLVRSLKKKSLWASSFEERSLLIVTFLHQAISEAFEDNGLVLVGTERDNKPERLGVAGLALHYANLINQIDNIVNQLYHGLPNSVKIALSSRCQTIDTKELPQYGHTCIYIFFPFYLANRAHQGFGWVGEWANTCNEFGKKGDTHNNVIRLQTLHHADMHKTDNYILENGNMVSPSNQCCETLR